MSKIAQALLSGARKTDGIYEVGERTLREWAARIIAGAYSGSPVTATAPRGI